nr:Fur family transcriptional regulator [uncultured Holophaga sp.]
MKELAERLRRCGIQPTPQRLAVAGFALEARTHPTADEVYAQVLPTCPTLSRATVYNTLNLLVERGLLQTRRLQEGTVRFDPQTEAHHHFVDDKTGQILDIPWGALKLQGHQDLEGLEVTDYHVVLRGHLKA